MSTFFKEKNLLKRRQLRENKINENIFDNINNRESAYILGLGYNKTYLEKSIKNIVPKEFMWDFIRGYFDGCVSKSLVSKTHILKDRTTKTYTHTNIIFKITSKTKLILDEIKDFFIEEGISLSRQRIPHNRKSQFKEIIENTEISLDNNISKLS